MNTTFRLSQSARQSYKRLIPFFYTSSQAKFQQALFVFNRAGLSLRHFRGRPKEYIEDYSVPKRELLELGLDEVVKQMGGSSLVFVEDTSIRINAISTESTDFPGLRAKEWMAETSFESLDAALSGKDRSAVVSSDIALYVPGLNRPIFFHGETGGVIATDPPSFPENPSYPWLSPHTFNGWFIPQGAASPLGAMEVEESLEFDFRVRSLSDMIRAVEEYTAILNLPGNAYSVRRPLPTPHAPQLFPTSGRGLLVIGPVCAGKTTMGERLAEVHSFTHIEASDVMLALANQTPQLKGAGAFLAARSLLKDKGHEVVANEIIDRFDEALAGDFVISGFRTLEELEIFRKFFPNVEVIVINASEKIRFSRYLLRPRGGEPNLSAFREIQTQQESFGLLGVADHVSDIGIRNVGTLDDYYHQIDSLLSEKFDSGVSKTRVGKRKATQTQLYRCLTILNSTEGFLSPTEIEELSRPEGLMARSTVRKVLGGAASLVEREGTGGRTRYRLNEHGYAYVRTVTSMS